MHIDEKYWVMLYLIGWCFIQWIMKTADLGPDYMLMFSIIAVNVLWSGDSRIRAYRDRYLAYRGWKSRPEMSALLLAVMSAAILHGIAAIRMWDIPPNSELLHLTRETPGGLMGAIIIGLILSPLVDEYCFRGLLWKILKLYGGLFALCVSVGLVSTLYSEKGQFYGIAMGIIFGLLLWLTRDVRICILGHIIVNSGVFVSATSGNYYDARGTLINCIIVTGVCLILLLAKRSWRRQLSEDWCRILEDIQEREALFHWKEDPGRALAALAGIIAVAVLRVFAIRQ